VRLKILIKNFGFDQCYSFVKRKIAEIMKPKIIHSCRLAIVPILLMGF